MLLFDKGNALSIHKKALGGDGNSIKIMQNVERFNDSRFRLVQSVSNLSCLECSFETLTTCDQVEEYELDCKVLLVCSKRRGGSRSFIVSKDIAVLFNALFYVQNFDKIIKESFLGLIKKDSKKLSILGHMCWSMWCLFTQKVSVLLDYMNLNINVEGSK